LPPRGLRAPSLHCRQSLAPSGSSLWAGKWGTPPGHSLFHRGVFYHLFTPSSRRGGRVFLPVSAGGPSRPAQVSTCDVCSRPVPGGGSRLSLEKAGGKSAGGPAPWTPFFMARSLLARSFWGLCHIVPVVRLFRCPCTCPDLGAFF
jgi:hypothetical protein